MEQAVQKFLSFLNLYSERNDSKLSSRSKLEVNFLRQLLSYSEESFQKHLEIFNNFDELSKYLLLSPLNRREMMNVVFFFYYRNSLLVGDREILFFDFRKIPQANFNSITAQEFYEMVRSEKFYEFLSIPSNQLTKKQREQKREILEFVKKERLDSTRLVQVILNIKKHYLDKLDSYDENDIKMVINCLRENQLAPELCSKIQKTLKEDFYKRVTFGLKSSESSKAVATTNPDANKKQHSIPHDVQLRLEHYLDLVTMKPKRIMSYDEVLLCVTLLLNFMKKEVVILFLQNVFPGWVKYPKNPLVWYRKMHEKLCFYQEDELLNSACVCLDESIFKLFIPKDDEEYRNEKKKMLIDLETCCDYLATRYDYELEVATRSLKRKDDTTNNH